VNPIVRVRGGVPRFAAAAFAGAPQTVVAFGTSMTLFGEYLAQVPAALRALTGNDGIALHNRGFRGYGSLHGAFRVESDVLPAAPDLVLLEFAHNELSPVAVDLAPPSLDGIVAQVRAARPDCEFVFVYLAPPGQAAAGPTPAMRAWEAVAERFGFPSIDVASPLEAAVAAGAADWEGPAGLTHDGVHYTPLAAEVVGRPFAAALADLVQASRAQVPVRVEAGATPFERTARAPAAAFVTGGNWAIGMPHNHDRRNAEAYDDRAAHAVSDGATLRIVANGLHVFAWVLGLGRLEIVRDGEYRSSIAVDTAAWNSITLATAMPAGTHTLEVAVHGGAVVLGDVLVAGVPAGA
jgi:lysophospholipase L1-like esterase